LRRLIEETLLQGDDKVVDGQSYKELDRSEGNGANQNGMPSIEYRPKGLGVKSRGNEGRRNGRACLPEVRAGLENAIVPKKFI